MCKIKIYRLLSNFFLVIFALSVILGLMGLAAAKTAGTYGDAGNWESYNYQIKTGETFLIVAAIGLAVSWPLGAWFNRKAINLLIEKHSQHNYDSDRIPPTDSEPMEPYDPTPTRDKPLKGKE